MFSVSRDVDPNGYQTPWEPLGPPITGTSIIFGIRDCRAKLLVDDGGNLVSCNYQLWLFADDHGIGWGTYFVPVVGNINVDKDKLIRLGEVFCQSDNFYTSPLLERFASDLMDRPPNDAEFIIHEGVEEIVLPQEYWRVLFVRIPKKRKIVYRHKFGLYCKK